MTKVVLLKRLKEYTIEKTKDLLLPVAQQKGCRKFNHKL